MLLEERLSSMERKRSLHPVLEFKLVFSPSQLDHKICAEVREI